MGSDMGSEFVNLSYFFNSYSYFILSEEPVITGKNKITKDEVG